MGTVRRSVPIVIFAQRYRILSLQTPIVRISHIITNKCKITFVYAKMFGISLGRVNRATGKNLLASEATSGSTHNRDSGCESLR